MTFDGRGGNAQNVSRFFNGETAEVAQFDHAGFLGIERRQGLERVVQRDQFGAAFDRPIDVFVQRELLKILATLFRIVLARMIDQQAAHYLSSNSEKVCAVLPVDPRLIDESQVRLMNQRCRLQRVIDSFTPQIIRRKLAQFIVDDG